MNHNKIHKKPMFWTIIVVTLVFAFFVLLIITHELNLTFTLDNLSSYNSFETIIYVPKMIVTAGFAILAFYALWFRINQTAQQIEKQEKQIINQEKQLNDIAIHKETDLLVDEINRTSDRLYELCLETERPNHFSIEFYKKEIKGEYPHAVIRYKNDYSSKKQTL